MAVARTRAVALTGVRAHPVEVEAVLGQGLPGLAFTGLADTSVETQAAASWTAWQILEAGVVGTKSLDDAKIGAFLKANRVDTIQGKLRFNGVGNFGDDLMRIKQVQNGKWVVVWPKEVTTGGAKLLAN